MKERKIIKPEVEFVLTNGNHKPVRLTGSEIKFVCHYFELTTTEFAKVFDVSHVAVLKWEKRTNQSTDMNWSTEKDIRLFVLAKIESKPIAFFEIYKHLSKKVLQPFTRKLIEIDAKKVA